MNNNAPQLPSVDSLAGIAAILVGNGSSNLDDSPRIALSIWQSCSKLLEIEKWNARNHHGPWEDGEDRFLTACELTRNDIDPFGDPRIVALDVFLKAVSPASKSKTISAKWRAFWEKESLNPFRGYSDYRDFYKNFQMPPDVESGIRRDSLLMCRDVFSKYLKRGNVEDAHKKGSLGPRLKKVYQAVRAVGTDEVLTTEIRDLLKSLKPEERNKAIEKLGLRPAAVSKLDAAIKDCKTPPSGRPRVRKQAQSRFSE